MKSVSTMDSKPRLSMTHECLSEIGFICASHALKKNGIGLGYGIGYKLELVTDKIDDDFNSLHKIEIRITHLNRII